MATERIHIPIDRFGRVVLPKPIRDRLGIREGTEFEVEEHEDSILLKPIVTQAEAVDVGGWLILKPSGEKEISLEETLKAIEDSREGRDKE